MQETTMEEQEDTSMRGCSGPARQETDDLSVAYPNNPLLVSMMRGEKARNSSLKQPYRVKGTDGWLRSTFVLEARAIDNFLTPWLITTVNAAIWTIVYKLADTRIDDHQTERWKAVYSLMLNTSLAFLLVFRLNRVAIRYWEARTMWGNVTLTCRSLVSGIIVHLKHAPEYRDCAIKWVGAYCISTMHFIRKERVIPSSELAGYLNRDEIDKLQGAEHPPLYATHRIRRNLKKALNVTAETPMQLAHAWSVQLNLFEKEINNLIVQATGMEKIRSTPLPLVYVTHLRTVLFFYLLVLPYLWVQEWSWGTIPVCSLTGFALLGIEGASSECEKPFEKERANHLALDTYCLIVLNNIQGLLLQSASCDMEDQCSGRILSDPPLIVTKGSVCEERLSK